MLYVNAKNSPNKVGNQTYGKYLYKIMPIIIPNRYNIF